jgi:hypothetical protein
MHGAAMHFACADTNATNPDMMSSAMSELFAARR